MDDNTDIVVGAGLWGCTLARRLAEECNRKVILLESRPKIGGNCSTTVDAETGIEVHDHGSHIFHTSNRRVYDFIRRFTDFNSYHHRVMSVHDGVTYPFPVSIPLLSKFYRRELTASEAHALWSKESVKKEIFDVFFRGYTSKQWGMDADKVDTSVISRIKARFSHDVGYFSDTWQGIPLDGYGSIFERMVGHPNITVITGREFKLSDGEFANRRVFYSGPIDRLFGYELGALPWRGLRFDLKTVCTNDMQGNAVVNYADVDVPYTRIHEFKHYHYEDESVMNCGKTVVSTEYPSDWKVGEEPYYPIKSDESERLYVEYMRLLHGCGREIVVGGRLGSYRYYDMDDAIEAALDIAI